MHTELTAQSLAQCLLSPWHISLAPVLAHRRVKVRIDCPVTAGGDCLTGAGANTSYLSGILKKVCGSCSLTCLQPTLGKAKGWAPCYPGPGLLLPDRACMEFAVKGPGLLSFPPLSPLTSKEWRVEEAVEVPQPVWAPPPPHTPQLLVPECAPPADVTDLALLL